MLIVFILTVSLVSGQSASNPPAPSKSKGNQTAQSQTQKDQPKPTAAIETALRPSVQSCCCPKCEVATKHDANEANQKPSEWWMIGFTSLLFFVACVQAGLFWWQLGLRKDGMKDTSLAANAAKASAEIAINSERAWLITELMFERAFHDLAKQGAPVKSKVLIKIKNAGRCPAEIEKVQAVAFLLPSSEEFFESPRYDETNKLFEIAAVPGEIIEVGATRHLLCPIIGASLLGTVDLSDIDRGRQRLYCYGRIDYKDISKVERVTQFGYYYYARKNASDDRLPAMYRIDNKKFNYTT
jgi:hypothetical protein